MELKDLLSAAFDSGLGSHHDCKTQKQFDEDKKDFFDNFEDEIKALNMRIVIRQSEQLFCEKVIHHTCKWFDQYNGCMGCLVKKYEAK